MRSFGRVCRVCAAALLLALCLAGCSRREDVARAPIPLPEGDRETVKHFRKVVDESTAENTSTDAP